MKATYSEMYGSDFRRKNQIGELEKLAGSGRASMF